MSFTVPAAADGWRLVDVCRAHLGVVARRAVGPLLAVGAVAVDGAVPVRPSARIAQHVRAGAVLDLDPVALARLERDGLLTPPSSEPLVVLHDDDALLVVDKPAGIHVHPMGRHRADTLLGRVLWRVGARPDQPWTSCAPSPAHRLDRPTRGLVLFARTAVVRDRVQQLLEAGQVHRRYTALVHGAPAATEGLVDVPLGPDPSDRRRQIPTPVEAGGRPAVSTWRVVEASAAPPTGWVVPGGASRLDLQLATGRTHQLRAHLAHLGHPILGDTRYGAAAAGGDGAAGGAGPAGEAGIALCAVELSLPHPVTGAPLRLRRPGHAPLG